MTWKALGPKPAYLCSTAWVVPIWALARAPGTSPHDHPSSIHRLRSVLPKTSATTHRRRRSPPSLPSTGIGAPGRGPLLPQRPLRFASADPDAVKVLPRRPPGPEPGETRFVMHLSRLPRSSSQRASSPVRRSSAVFLRVSPPNATGFPMCACVLFTRCSPDAARDSHGL